MTADTEPPTWKRFCDEPPPNGFYWARLPRTSSDFWTIVEVDGNYINFPGDDLCEVIEASEYWTNVTHYEYYSQPILPPP